jgi:hypothetical protein
VDEAALALADRTGQYATEVLQLVMLHKAIGIAVKVPVGRISITDAMPSESEIGFSDMSGVFAHERKDTKNLGNKKYADNPWTQTARCGCWKHQVSCRLLCLATILGFWRLLNVQCGLDRKVRLRDRAVAGRKDSIKRRRAYFA